MKKIFIDGKSGTTGLRIYDRLAQRADIELITLSDVLRRDPEARAAALNAADYAFLCLPDAAAQEAVSFIKNPDTVILDTSTAHRTQPGWAYGFPELGPEFAQAVKTGKRIAVPGCHASGFIALVYPLVRAGILPPEALLSCHSLTGYSGGGKSMIAEYEAKDRSPLLHAPRQYGLAQAHKHLKEMQMLTGLAQAPLFCPIVADFYSGMLVTVPLFTEQLEGAGIDDLRALYAQIYAGPIVRYLPDADEAGFLSAGKCSGLDSMEISVFGNGQRVLLCARYDNLGKGASGAALECLNLAMGVDAAAGLQL